MHVFRGFEGLEGAGNGVGRLFGDWLGMLWSLEAVVRGLVAGFGRLGGPRGEVPRGVPWFWPRFVGQLEGGRWGVWKLANPTSHSLVAPCKQGAGGYYFYMALHGSYTGNSMISA